MPMYQRELRKHRRRRRAVKGKLVGRKSGRGFFVAGIKITNNLRRL
jgi:hypothetical protein